MVSSTLCPAVHILGSQNVYGRAEGIADHYWPWAVFFFFLFSSPPSSFCDRRHFVTDANPFPGRGGRGSIYAHGYSHYIMIKEKAAWEQIKMLLETDFCYRRSRWSGSPLYLKPNLIHQFSAQASQKGLIN